MNQSNKKRVALNLLMGIAWRFVALKRILIKNCKRVSPCITMTKIKKQRKFGNMLYHEFIRI